MTRPRARRQLGRLTRTGRERAPRQAARAGDQGRGFAVVADQVGKLAEESQTAATHIASLIVEIQTETATTVTAVADGAKRTQESVAVVERAREAFEQIRGQVEEVTASVGEIVRATTEVAAVAEQTAASTQQVSASTEQTGASAQEVAASAEELSASADDLRALVGQFKITV